MKIEKIAFFSLWKKQLVRENEEMILKESQGLRDIEISVCQGVSKTTLKLLCSQMQLGKGSQLKSAKGKVLGAKTRRDQVQAPKWCLPVELPGATELPQQYHVATGMKCCQPGKLIGVLVSKILTGVNHVGLRCLHA